MTDCTQPNVSLETSPEYQEGHSHCLSKLKMPWGAELDLMEWGGLKLPVFGHLSCKDDEVTRLSREEPATWELAGDGQGIGIFMHESVPREYREPLLFHELFEAELFFEHGVMDEDAHAISAAMTHRYAKIHFTPEEYSRFVEWEERTILRNKP